jgi:hypothetical protein
MAAAAREPIADNHSKAVIKEPPVEIYVAEQVASKRVNECKKAPRAFIRSESSSRSRSNPPLHFTSRRHRQRIKLDFFDTIRCEHFFDVQSAIAVISASKLVFDERIRREQPHIRSRALHRLLTTAPRSLSAWAPPRIGHRWRLIEAVFNFTWATRIACSLENIVSPALVPQRVAVGIAGGHVARSAPVTCEFGLVAAFLPVARKKEKSGLADHTSKRLTATSPG